MTRICPLQLTIGGYTSATATHAGNWFRLAFICQDSSFWSLVMLKLPITAIHRENAYHCHKASLSGLVKHWKVYCFMCQHLETANRISGLLLSMSSSISL